jgi:hypothetical protein
MENGGNAVPTRRSPRRTDEPPGGVETGIGALRWAAVIDPSAASCVVLVLKAPGAARSSRVKLVGEIERLAINRDEGSALALAMASLDVIDYLSGVTRYRVPHPGLPTDWERG